MRWQHTGTRRDGKKTRERESESQVLTQEEAGSQGLRGRQRRSGEHYKERPSENITQLQPEKTNVHSCYHDEVSTVINGKSKEIWGKGPDIPLERRP